MADLDIKQVEPLIKQFSPPEEVKKTFYETLFGSLMGQTVLFVGLLAIYFAIVAVLYEYAKAPLQAFRDDLGAPWFWSILATPFACILLFAALPTALRALRERRLRAMAIGGVPRPGYFRLQPYGPDDHDVFKRLDGVDSEILSWLKSTKSSLLYLSGASGVGKSSLLSAGVLPKLREAGWSIVETRVFGDPVERVRAALLGAKSIFKRKPADTLSLEALLKSAAEANARARSTPLLLVIDQFEEFLILHNEAGLQAFAALLNNLAQHSIDGLRLLLVFRSDYRPLVFKLSLPPLAPGENWYELAPYDRREAASLLQVGGRELSPNALDALFRGLDRIEEAPGLYKLITLNMIGLVLDTMGGTLRGDPSKLIQTYLTDSLTRTASRDFGRLVLTELITDAGTKQPHSEAELVAKTHLEPWQVNATLADLARRALVRRLEGSEMTWEIAHDFLARTIGQLIGRLKPTLMQRARPLVAPVVLVGWGILLAITLLLSQERMVEKTLRENFGVGILPAKPTGIAVDLSELDDLTLTDVAPLLERLHGLTAVKLETKNITSLEPLRGLGSLSSLDLRFATGITSLEPLRGLGGLSSLNLAVDAGITSLEPLRGLGGLSSLDLTGATGITSLEPLRGLGSLSSLDLRFATSITSLEPLRGLGSLSSLNLTGATGITSLEPLRGLGSLSTLDLSYATGITSLEPLRGLGSLSSLDLSFATGITSLEPLRGLGSLSSLDLSFATGITSLEPLRGLGSLSSLNLTYATGITSLEPLNGTKVHIIGSPSGGPLSR